MCSEDVFSLKHFGSRNIYYYCFDFRQARKIYFFSETARRAPEHTQLPIQRVPGVFPPEVKKTRYEDLHKSPSSVKGNKEWKCTSVSPYAYMGCSAISIFTDHLYEVSNNGNGYVSHVGRDSSVSIATRYELDGRGSNPHRGQDFPRPSRQGLGSTQPPVQWLMGVVPGDKAWRLSPTPSSAEVKERLEVHIYSPSGFSWPVLG